MNEKIFHELNSLQENIKSQDIVILAKKTMDWSGADVVIKDTMDKNTESWLGNQPVVISHQKFAPRRRAIITEYSKELSWLFNQLKRIYSAKIDFISKYDFYGILAQSAIDYLNNDNNNKSLKFLLLTVLESSKSFLEIEYT